MKLFRKKVELSEKEMKEFVQIMGEQSEPHYIKQRERGRDESWLQLSGGGLSEEEIKEPDKIGEKEEPPLRSRSEIRAWLEQRCENIQEANEQIEAIRTEYQEVSSYLQDIQLIERAQEEQRGQMEDAARHILALRKEAGKKARPSGLTDYQYKTMERYQDILVSEMKRIEEEEKYHALIRSDLQKLEGEKGSLVYEQEEIQGKFRFLRRISIAAGILAVLLFAGCLYLFFAKGVDITVPFLVTAMGSLIIAAYVFYGIQKNRYAVKVNDRKRNRLITLQNRVKIKYVNNTASLDYSYEKYGVNNSMELRYRWEQYVSQQDEQERQEQSKESLRYYERHLFYILQELELHDPDIWNHQVEALLDQREMVEVRHMLNARRQKLRERLEYNDSLKNTAQEELRQFRKKNPQERERLQVLLANYEVTI